MRRARAQIRNAQSHERGGRRSRAARRPMRLLPVGGPPAADEGTRRECPVCLEEVTANAEWVVFPCRHSTCADCYHRIVGKLLEDDAACPMCRAPLAEPVPGANLPVLCCEIATLACMTNQLFLLSARAGIQALG